MIRVGLEKNNDDKIQRFLYLSKQADVDIQGGIGNYAFLIALEERIDSIL